MKMFENVYRRTADFSDDGVIGILIAHLGAFGLILKLTKPFCIWKYPNHIDLTQMHLERPKSHWLSSTIFRKTKILVV